MEGIGVLGVVAGGWAPPVSQGGHLIAHASIAAAYRGSLTVTRTQRRCSRNRGVRGLLRDHMLLRPARALRIDGTCCSFLWFAITLPCGGGEVAPTSIHMG